MQSTAGSSSDKPKQTRYIIDSTTLKPGDIIISTTSGRVSKVVRAATNSEFSHVMLYVGSGYIIDATNIGVHSRLLCRELLKQPNHARVCRYAENISDEVVRDIISYVRVHVGKEYSTSQAALAVKKLKALRPSVDSSNRQFCSRLVAEAYATAGLPLVENLSYCTPEDVNSSARLVEVKGCVREATAEEIAFCNSPGAFQDDVMIEMQNTILAKVREVADVDVQDFTALSRLATNSPGLDYKIVRILRDSGYFEAWRDEYETNYFFYSAEKFRDKFPDVETQMEVAKERHQANEIVYQRYSQTLRTLQAMYQERESETVKAEIDLYNKLLELYHERRATFNTFLNPALAAAVNNWKGPDGLLDRIAPFLPRF